MLFSLDGVNTGFNATNSKYGILSTEYNNMPTNHFFTPIITGSTAADAAITNNLLDDNLGQGRTHIDNQGFIKRCNMTNNQASSFISLDNLANTASNYIYSDAPTGTIIYYMRGLIPLCVLHSFFENLSTVMGANIKLELTLNTGKNTVSDKTGLFESNTPVFSRNNTSPIMIAPVGHGFNPGDTVAAKTFVLSCKIGHAGAKPSTQPDPLLYTKNVKYTGEYMSQFLKSPLKTIIYHDYYTFYQILLKQINQLITCKS
jgi:hypothetical protein